MHCPINRSIDRSMSFTIRLTIGHLLVTFLFYVLAICVQPMLLHTHLKNNNIRCGAGTNNIPVARMTELGIPVFNTPGANANAVKELVVCGMFLGSRRVIDGINHMKDLGSQGLAKERVEKDKALYVNVGVSDSSCLYYPSLTHF